MVACWYDRQDVRAMPTTVLVVDDHPSFRAVARALLELEGYDVIGEAATVADAVLAADELRPDVLLVDIGLPDSDGFALTERVLARPEPPTVVLTSNRARENYGPRIDASGAAGFVPKDELSGPVLRELLV